MTAADISVPSVDATEVAELLEDRFGVHPELLQHFARLIGNAAARTAARLVEEHVSRTVEAVTLKAAFADQMVNRDDWLDV